MPVPNAVAQSPLELIGKTPVVRLNRIPPEDGADCEPELLPASGIGPGTQLFAEVPNPFSEPCGPLPEAICWPSDHIGTQVAIECD